MRTLALALSLLALAGCVPAGMLVPTSGGPMLASPMAAPYLVDPRIAGKYGVEGPAFWVLNPGRRPAIFLLGPQGVEFEAGTPAERVEAFLRAHQGRLERREVLPAAPDGSIPAKVTDTYMIAFEPHAGDMADFAALLATISPAFRPIVASDRDARVLYNILRARRDGAAYGVRFMGLNGLGCVPEDCGVAPDDPYAGPAQAQAAGAGPSPVASPPVPSPPEPHSHVALAGDRGEAYVVGNALMVEAPGQAPREILTWPNGTSVVLVDPALRFVLLHERDVPGIPTPGVKPHDDSRLVRVMVQGGARTVLVERFYDWTMDAALAPDGRTLAVRTILDRSADGPRLFLLDLGADAPAPRPWLPGFRAYRFTWAPRGLTMALTGTAAGPDADGLFVATPTDETARPVAGVPAGVPDFEWLADGARLAATTSRAKYEGVLHVVVADVRTGTAATHDLPIAPGADHVEAIAFSPDGGRVLFRRIGKGSGSGLGVATLATGTWEHVDAGEAPGRVPRWTPDGELVCPDANGGLAPCPTTPAAR